MEYLSHLLILVTSMAVLVIALNLVLGYTGLLSIASAAFYGIGAYTFAILTVRVQASLFVGLIGAIVISGLVAALLNIVLSRFRGDYYMLVTLGFTYIIQRTLTNWESLTFGPRGIPGVPGFGSTSAMLVASLILLLVVYLIARHIVRSSFGCALMAIREDEDALAVFGYRVSTFKFFIFTIFAMMTGAAGALFYSYIGFIHPSGFSAMVSLTILSAVMIGGAASLPGSVLGAVIINLLPEALRFVGFAPAIIGHMRQVIYGLILLLLVLYRPKGLLGTFRL